MSAFKELQSVRAFAPATVANVCCGFDILGFSVGSPGDEVEVTRKDQPGVVITSIEGDDGRLPHRADLNTAGVAIQSFLKSQGLEVGVNVALRKNLPLGSGMGSSAASGVAALVAVNHLLGNLLTREQLVPHAMEAERVACGSAHADNVAPSLLGGFILVRDYNPLDIIKIPATEDLFCTLIHPHLELKTSDSRRVLRKTVPLKDAIIQGGNIGGLMVGLMKPDYSLISRSLRDVIAEPIRSVFIPGFDGMRNAALEAGALGCGISGSGPTIFALSENALAARLVGEAIQKHFLKSSLGSDIYMSKVSSEGAHIIK
jgi:homoserine kinase